MNIFKKYSLIKKIFMPILILAIFLTPVSPILEKKSANLTVNVAKAEEGWEEEQGDKLMLNTPIVYDTKVDYTLSVSLKTNNGELNGDVWKDRFDEEYIVDNNTVPPSYKLNVIASLQKGNSKANATLEGIKHSQGRIVIPVELKGDIQQFPINFYDLDPATDYFFSVNLFHKKGLPTVLETTFTTAVDSTHFGTTDTTGITGAPPEDLDLNCSIFPTNFNLYGCAAEFVYLVFKVVSSVGKLAGWFLDFFVYYSTDSTSYKSSFVSEGWKVIRDISNIFFILALLYIAIKTILNLNVSDNKKLISYIVIVALLINFSMFFTQVVIDSTNILAKVFYNNMSAIDKNGTSASVTGEKAISTGLISKFNPQKIISQEVYDKSGGTTLFIFTTLLAICIVLYTAYVFFVVGILFVSRVVMLWILMIFSPIAFASYTLPFDIPGVGHKEWWGELLKNAFLAPIFVFFLYIIVMFAGFLSSIVSYPDGADFLQKVMSVVVPFFILMIMIMKAKDIAIKYAGEMGAALQKAGAAVAGLALGAATGGLAFAGRNTFGALGNRVANSSMLAKMEASGNTKVSRMLGTGLRNIGKTAAKGSFDARGISVGGKSLASTGLMVGKAGGEGGYTKERADKAAKRQARAEELKSVIEKGEAGKKVKKYEKDLQAILNNPIVYKAISETERELELEKKKLVDLNAIYGAGKNTQEQKDTIEKIKDLNQKKTAIKEGGKYEEKTGEMEEVEEYQQEQTVNGIIVPAGMRKIMKPKTREVDFGSDPNFTTIIDGKKTNIKDLERNIIPKAKEELEAEKRKIANSYAKKISSGWKGWLGANKDAAHKIIMDEKLTTEGKKAH